jgi:hypothetical protein
MIVAVINEIVKINWRKCIGIVFTFTFNWNITAIRSDKFLRIEIAFLK